MKENYDWVLNGRHALLSVKIREPLAEFDKIIKRVAADEGNLPKRSESARP